MAARTPHHTRWRTVASGAVSLLLTGVAATPAHAESVRDKQWHLNAMQAEKMWQTSTGKGVTVAVIDTGVNADLPNLRGQVLPGMDLAPERAGDEHADPKGHGTYMAMLIAGTGKGSGGNGTFGLAPGAKVLPIRVQDDGLNSNQHIIRDNKRFSRGIRYAADHGAKVINISMALVKGSPHLTAAVRYALDKGSLVFAGVGNEGISELRYPASTPGVVGVGAVGKSLRKTKESQYGPQVDLAAPGDEIYTTCASGTGICNGHGTSAATALASASAALIWSKHPDWTNNQVLRVMLNTIGAPTDGAKRNDSIGYGIVRPRVALEKPGNPGAPDEYPLPDLKQSKPGPKPKATSPTPSTAPGSAAQDESDDGDGDGGGIGTTAKIGLGVGAAALIGGVVAAVAVARRRRAAAPPNVFGRP
ncbi:type VII secretion-associated serine protease mycosin [Streptomyces flavofungini]|uniref:type VII secretion-associated serine protease mycosin n=1 Tax=Streptomyces flavofungini TaxID=68200 RepID=UPI0025B20FD3|nr:type VII secretion-associated serine protease mycosin [Streptomyces flavofungini]WJV47796.1 type VII secretion-associated serine protease mycosin [Streptomyces flavofungini]